MRAAACDLALPCGGGQHVVVRKARVALGAFRLLHVLRIWCSVINTHALNQQRSEYGGYKDASHCSAQSMVVIRIASHLMPIRAGCNLTGALGCTPGTPPLQ